MLHLELYNHDVLKASHGFEVGILNDPTNYIIQCCYDTKIPEVTYDKYKP
jgi:hypothetical protein